MQRDQGLRTVMHRRTDVDAGTRARLRFASSGMSFRAMNDLQGCLGKSTPPPFTT